MNIKNKKGAQGVSGGMVLLIIVALVVAVVFIPGVQDIFKPGEVRVDEVVSKCPSSGLTEITLNVQEALASTATNANVAYYAFDNGVLVKEGNTGTDGTVSFDLGCGANQRYTVLLINETVDTGFYPEQITVDASGPTDVHNLKMYQFGDMHIANIGSSVDPAEASNVSGGAGKTCGFVISFAVNESSSAYNKPLIMCATNTTSVVNVHLNGVTEAEGPSRLSTISGKKWYVWEVDKMMTSTEGAMKLTGTIQFSASTTPYDQDNMTCSIVDQTTFKVAEYKTLSLSEGFLEAAENTETSSEIGGFDSNFVELAFGHTSGYC